MLGDTPQWAIGERESGVAPFGENGPKPFDEVLIGIGRMELDDLEIAPVFLAPFGDDGDRIMAVYLGDSKNSDAARTALKVNYSVREIINPAIKDQYPRSSYTVRHVVGIDTSNLFVARIGVRGDNDLVWVGRAANYAAKLSDGAGAPSQITADVYNRLKESSKYGKDGQNMWVQTTAPELGYKTIYTSTWQWSI